MRKYRQEPDVCKEKGRNEEGALGKIQSVDVERRGNIQDVDIDRRGNMKGVDI